MNSYFWKYKWRTCHKRCPGKHELHVYFHLFIFASQESCEDVHFHIICILNKHCSILKIQIINTFFIPLFLYSKWRLDWLESLGYLGSLSWIIVCWAAKEIKDKVMYTPKAKKWWTPLSWF